MRARPEEYVTRIGTIAMAPLKHLSGLLVQTLVIKQRATGKTLRVSDLLSQEQSAITTSTHLQNLGRGLFVLSSYP